MMLWTYTFKKKHILINQGARLGTAHELSQYQSYQRYEPRCTNKSQGLIGPPSL